MLWIKSPDYTLRRNCLESESIPRIKRGMLKINQSCVRVRGRRDRLLVDGSTSLN
jgi:hypothetical protein